MKAIIMLAAVAALTLLYGGIVYHESVQTSLGAELLDHTSYANTKQLIQTRFELDLNLNFEKKIFEGTQVLHMKVVTWDGVDVMYLDVDGLTIKSVTYSVDKNPLEWSIDSPSNIGSRLVINIPKQYFHGDEFKVNIEYETSTEASAVTWLNPEQTVGKKLPYMYTQCQSISCRSIMPIQDTPSVKVSYSVSITSPADIVVRVSGEKTHESADETHRYTQFVMKDQVPSYLFAIAAGNLMDKQIGKRTYVISEPEDLDQVASEFEDLEDYLTTAEGYLDAYHWVTYNMLVLPPSYHKRGMENPYLTYISPSFATEDKSAVHVAIHELCHTWFGNTVTSKYWNDIWLNEGFAVFAERKVVEIISGVAASKELGKLGNSTMMLDMDRLGFASEYTKLNPNIKTDNPDNYLTSIPYEKGYQFLMFIQSLIGEDTMQNYLRAYIKKFKFENLDSDEFEEHFRSFLKGAIGVQNAELILSQIDFHTWIDAPGFTPEIVNLDTDGTNAAIAMAESFLQKAPEDGAKDIYDGFSVTLKTFFYSYLLEHSEKLDNDIAEHVDSILGSSSETSGEVVSRWLQVAIPTNHVQSPFDAANAFVGSVGYIDQILPVYKAMAKVDKAQAQAIYNSHKDFYAPNARKAIEGSVNMIKEELVSM